MLRTGVRWLVGVGTVAAVAALTPSGAAAQADRPVRDWEPRGARFDFRPDGVWRKRARAVAAARAAALARGDFRTLNAPVQAAGPFPSAYAVTGVLNVPAILIKYADTPGALLLGDTTTYSSVLFGATPPLGRPYTVRTFYEQLSGGLFSMHGTAVGWVPLAKAESLYTGPSTGCTPYGTCNGIFNSSTPGVDPYGSLVAGLAEAVHRADSMGVDWSRFGFDSTTGILDMVVFVQPGRDGACRGGSVNNHVWSHRSWLSPVTTTTPWPGHAGQFLRISDYTIQSGVGGAQGCDSTQVMPIGTAAHETGHGLGLPDLYDTGSNTTTEGIGEWGLMGSGNYARPLSPAFFEAWSRTYVGWTTVRPLTSAGAYTFGPVETGDTVFLLRPSGSNPRGEYFLLENRQGIGSDSALVARKGSPGLLIWHVDSLKLNGSWGSNLVNSGSIHGVTLVEADGLNELLSSVNPNRGDAGDPFPGSTARTHLGNDAGSPSNQLNTGAYAGFVLDSIAQLVPGGAMRLRLSLGAALAVAATDTVAKVRVRGQQMGAYRQYLLQGDTATVDIDLLQTNPAGTAEYRFNGWSDGGARTHLVTTGSRDTAITAALARRFVLAWTVTGPGTVSVTPAASASGAFFTDGDTVGLTARPNPGAVFMGWGGSVATSTAHIVLTAAQPNAVTATFSPAPLDSVVAQLLDGHGLNPLVVVTLDFQGNQNGGFDLGDFLAWLDHSGTAVSAQLLSRVFGRTRP